MRFSIADRFFPAELSLFDRALLCCPAFSPVRRTSSSHAERFSLADQVCLGPSLALCPAPLFAPNLLLPPRRPSRTLRPFLNLENHRPSLPSQADRFAEPFQPFVLFGLVLKPSDLSLSSRSKPVSVSFSFGPSRPFQPSFSSPVPSEFVSSRAFFPNLRFPIF